MYHSGPKSFGICRALFRRLSGNNSSIDLKLIDLDLHGPPSLDIDSKDAIHVIISDEIITREIIDSFSKIPTRSKIFLESGDGDEPTAHLDKLQKVIDRRIKLTQKKSTNVPWETGNYNNLDYLALASRISSGCTRHLLQKIEDYKSGGGISVASNNLQIESIVGLFQPPVAGTPVSGTTDVAMCIHMVERVYAYPEAGPGTIPSSPEKNVTNVNWESLFTLLYAMLVACRSSNINLVESDSSSITLEISKPPMSNNDSELKNFEKTVEELLNRSQESNFFHLKQQSDTNKLTIELITAKTPV